MAQARRLRDLGRAAAQGSVARDGKAEEQHRAGDRKHRAPAVEHDEKNGGASQGAGQRRQVQVHHEGGGKEGEQGGVAGPRPVRARLEQKPEGRHAGERQREGEVSDVSRVGARALPVPDRFEQERLEAPPALEDRDDRVDGRRAEEGADQPGASLFHNPRGSEGKQQREDGDGARRIERRPAAGRGQGGDERHSEGRRREPQGGAPRPGSLRPGPLRPGPGALEGERGGRRNGGPDERDEPLGSVEGGRRAGVDDERGPREDGAERHGGDDRPDVRARRTRRFLAFFPGQAQAML